LKNVYVKIKNKEVTQDSNLARLPSSTSVFVTLWRDRRKYTK